VVNYVDGWIETVSPHHAYDLQSGDTLCGVKMGGSVRKTGWYESVGWDDNGPFDPEGPYVCGNCKRIFDARTQVHEK